MVLASVFAAAFSMSAVASEFVTLDNGQGLRATISPVHGGELAGLEIELDGDWRELIYRARNYSKTDGWRGKAQTLWPAVGVTLDEKGEGNGYRVDGVYFPMPAHGFARDYPWRLVAQGRDGQGSFAELALADSEQTRVHYPFDFALRVEYRLSADRLAITYTVHAGIDNTGPMPFSIGNHVTFKAPLLDVGKASDMRFRNEFPDYLVRAEDRTFAGNVVPSSFRGEQPLSALPKRSAVGLGGTSGAAELIVIDPSGLTLGLRHWATFEPEAPVIRFNLWADAEEGFFSPEPWLGTQNALNSGAGLVRLEPGADWKWTIEIKPGWAELPTPTQPEKSP